MSRTYKATGINLKSMPLGETDRLVTVLTPEFGLVRAVAPGARKPKSRLRGRIEMFVVNELLIAKGRSLDKIVQAETLASYPKLGKDLGKLTASQYLAELLLCVALSEQPQVEFYDLLNDYLRHIEAISTAQNSQDFAIAILSHLACGIFQVLAIAGLEPQVRCCCLTRRAIAPNPKDLQQRVKFSFEAGGILTDAAVFEGASPDSAAPLRALPRIDFRLRGIELALLQQLAIAPSPAAPQTLSSSENLKAALLNIERLLRRYAQYHLGKSIRSAALIDTLYISEF